jgi:hypothetical protein
MLYKSIPHDAKPSPLHFGYHRDTPLSRLPENARRVLEGLRSLDGFLIDYPTTASITAFTPLVVPTTEAAIVTARNKILAFTDPDHDGWSSLEEYQRLSGSLPGDKSGPRYPDNPYTAGRDLDADGFTNGAENLLETDPRDPLSHPTFELEIAGGDEQVVPGNKLFPAPLVVRAMCEGWPVAGAEVEFATETSGLLFRVAEHPSSQTMAAPLKLRTGADGCARVVALAPGGTQDFNASITCGAVHQQATLTSFLARILATGTPVVNFFTMKHLKGSPQTGYAGRLLHDRLAVQISHSIQTLSGVIPLPAAGLPVTFACPTGGSVLDSSGKAVPLPYTLNTDHTGTAAVRLLAPATAGAHIITATFQAEQTNLNTSFQIISVAAPGTGTGTGEANPPFVIAWQAPYHSAHVNGSFTGKHHYHFVNYKISTMETNPTPVSFLKPPDNEQTHYQLEGLRLDGTGKYSYCSYDPEFAMLPDVSSGALSWQQKVSDSAAPHAGNLASYGSVPSFSTQDKDLVVGGFLELASGMYQKTEEQDPNNPPKTVTYTQTHETIRKARLVALAPGTQQRVSLPQGVTMSFLPVAITHETNTSPPQSWTEVLGQGTITVTIPPGASDSGFDIITAHMLADCPLPAAENRSVSIRLLPMELAPEKLTSNGDFDEGDTGGTAAQETGAIADNRNHTLIAERASVDGRVSAGDVVTDDLHQGWFGLRPGVMPDDFFNGATVTITKKNKTDPDTGKREPGQVRFFATWGTNQELMIQPDDPFMDGDLANNPAPRNLVGKVYGINKTVPSGATFWIEGIAPGKITLEYRIQKGSTDIKHEQTFEVRTEWTKAQWLAVVRDEIYLDSFTSSSGAGKNGFNNTGIDMNQYVVANDFLLNRPYIYSVYEYYAKLHDKERDKFLWAGLAKLAGAPIYAGMSDAQYGKEGAAIPRGVGIIAANALQSIQDLLIDANINIYNDLAYQFVAFRTGGIKSMKYLKDQGTIDGPVYDAWKQLDEDGDVSSANQTLLQREQRDILRITYLNLDAMLDGWVSWLFSIMTNNPIPGGPSFQTVIPNGNIAIYNDRWAWITDAQQGMWPLWVSKPNTQRQGLANQNLRSNAAGFSFWLNLLPLR